MNYDAPNDADRDRVRALLGREPQGDYSIVVRDANGDPVVLQNAPLLDDGTPMPTRYWLVGPEEHKRIGQLEASGGVNAAEAAIDPNVLAAAHQRYADERDRALPADHAGPVPSGGVGGTRVGVKCLHAHWAWYLAGGDDPVGAWIATQLGETDGGDVTNTGPTRSPAPTSTDRVSIGPEATTVDLANGAHATIAWGSANLTERWLADADPPSPADLTNALGTIDDELDDIVRTNVAWRPNNDLVFAGPAIGALVGLELGHDDVPPELAIGRETVEELFRLTATATTSERATNPGLPADHVADIVAVCCIVLAVMRRFQLTQAQFVGGQDVHGASEASPPGSPPPANSRQP